MSRCGDDSFFARAFCLGWWPNHSIEKEFVLFRLIEAEIAAVVSAFGQVATTPVFA